MIGGTVAILFNSYELLIDSFNNIDNEKIISFV